ncbi:MAG: chemotaxis protein CheX [Candidatus Lindowbacteria bacterium]|nr:chemotaxis protein CheX [Candidatus Lindowbacteria bacterium]
MKAEYMNPFAEASFYVMKEVLMDESLTRGQLGVQKGAVVSAGMTTVIGIIGQLEGSVLFDMTTETALAIAGEMNGGETFTELDSLVRSTINEMANMISGNASARLSSSGFNCDISPPTMVVGKGTEVFLYKADTRLALPIITKCGEVNLAVSIAEKVKK